MQALPTDNLGEQDEEESICQCKGHEGRRGQGGLIALLILKEAKFGGLARVL